MFSQILAVALGGAIGATARFLNSKLFEHIYGTPQIWATFMVNVMGCFFMGYLFQVVQTSNYKSFLMIGLLGSLTTWSSFSMETVLLFNQGLLMKAAFYFIITSVSCLIAFYLGSIS